MAINQEEIEAYEAEFGSADQFQETEESALEISRRAASLAQVEKLDVPQRRRGISSFVFQPGERIPDSMLRVLRPSFTNRYGQLTWRTAICACDCGREVELPYHLIYQRKFSCGCTRRKNRRNDGLYEAGALKNVNYTGMGVKHHETGREIEILYKDDSFLSNLGEEGDLERWVYLNKCCGQVAELMVIVKTNGTMLNRLYWEAKLPCKKCGV